MKNVFKFDFSNLRGDFFGGITAGIVALPLALAFGEQTELGAIAGLYGAIALAIVAALFGGTPTQISGPTAPMTVVSTVVIMDAINHVGGLEAAFPIIIATFFLAGLLEMLLGVLQVGRYIKYIPYPVVSGFMSGIGLIIVITQIFPFFGAGNPSGGTVGVIKNLGTIPEIINWYSVLVAAITIILIYLVPKVTKVVPSSLISLFLVSIAAFLIFQNGDVKIINDSTPGGVPTGLPELQLGFWSVFTEAENLKLIFRFAFTLAALGAIDSLLTSIVADNLTKTKHESNQELIGQGLGNMASALIGGLPGAGATMRTVINVNSGGKTKISGVIAGLLLLFILLGLGPLVGKIPNAVLAGILITVGIGIIDYKGIRHLKSIPRTDAVIMIVVMLLTVFVGLLEAVAIGMIMAALLFMKSIADVIDNRTEAAPLKAFVREIPWKDEGDIIERVGEQVFIKHLDGPLFFGFASRFQEMIKAIPNIKVVIIRMDRVPYMDQSGLYAMEDAIMDLENQGIRVVFTGVHGQPKVMLERIKIIPGLVEDEDVFEDFESCAKWLEGYLRDNIEAIDEANKASK
ncbi:MAG: SulP family inorganic anion transporter [Saprospiraceae bacterium]|nr:SulP family inorganic anion transporter [Saprospiraceae bacterium]